MTFMTGKHERSLQKARGILTLAAFAIIAIVYVLHRLGF